MSGKPVICARELTKQFGIVTALRSATFDLAQGAFLSVFGRNGAGKTTLLKILSSLIRSYSGDVILFGQDMKRSADAIRRRVGLVSHESMIYPDLSVLDNLDFYARLYRIANPRARIGEMIERLDLTSKSSTPARALSRGMTQRLSLARAFLHDPELLLLDEPFTGLDESAADTLHRLFADYKAAGGSVVMSTHDVERGWKHADCVLILERGRLVYQSATADTDVLAFRSRYREVLSG